MKAVLLFCWWDLLCFLVDREVEVGYVLGSWGFIGSQDLLGEGLGAESRSPDKLKRAKQGFQSLLGNVTVSGDGFARANLSLFEFCYEMTTGTELALQW